MADAVLRIFSYLPNPRVWKAQIAAKLAGVEVEVVGAAPDRLSDWLWDFEARPLAEEERTEDSPWARVSRRGFSGTLFKTDSFLERHPFGTVPAAFSPDGQIGIFESNSILRAVARAAGPNCTLYGRDGYEASRVDSFLDASLVFAREAQVYLLGMREMTETLHRRMLGASEFFFDGIDRALSNDAFIAGGELTLADVAFACDLAQLLFERRSREALAAKGMVPVSDSLAAYGRTARHLLDLVDRPAFAHTVGSALDRYRQDLESYAQAR